MHFYMGILPTHSHHIHLGWGPASLLLLPLPWTLPALRVGLGQGLPQETVYFTGQTPFCHLPAQGSHTTPMALSPGPG